jgi:hypothetical protein
MAAYNRIEPGNLQYEKLLKMNSCESECQEEFILGKREKFNVGDKVWIKTDALEQGSANVRPRAHLRPFSNFGAPVWHFAVKQKKKKPRKKNS